MSMARKHKYTISINDYTAIDLFATGLTARRLLRKMRYWFDLAPDLGDLRGNRFA